MRERILPQSLTKLPQRRAATPFALAKRLHSERQMVAASLQQAVHTLLHAAAKLVPTKDDAARDYCKTETCTALQLCRRMCTTTALPGLASWVLGVPGAIISLVYRGEDITTGVCDFFPRPSPPSKHTCDPSSDSELTQLWNGPTDIRDRFDGQGSGFRAYGRCEA